MRWKAILPLKGESNILNKLRNMILEAQERIYISVPGQVLKTVLPDIKER
jgi:hypothetical protein